jgi:DNA recombination protein RmuC
MSIQLLILVFLGILILLSLIILIIMLSRRGQAGQSLLPQEQVREQLAQLNKIEDSVEQLWNLFTVPHVRGGVGETLLEELLKNWLPPKAYSMQYNFHSGARVDAAVHLGEYLVPIDAKFPLESVRQSLDAREEEKELPQGIQKSILNHIDTIAARYIRPSEGTLHFALMYLPSERLYYELFARRESDLLQRALHKGVVPVSPAGLFLYLQTVAYGLRGLALPERQREMVQLLYQLRRDIDEFSKSFSVAGNHLKNLNRAFEESRTRLQQLELLLDKMDFTGDSGQPNA